MADYREISKELQKEKFLKLVSDFSMFAGYKIHIENQAFLKIY